ncbi:chorismate lyase [Providencia manganoxydans]|uniref:chorismate lyase n=1 Tax=Providencia manganoxydans TaxID=2923283 RepID=UPI0034DD6EA4
MDETLFAPRPITWLSETDNLVPDNILSWLYEQGSMTKRLEQHCQRVTVIPYTQRYVTLDALSEEEVLSLPVSEYYWLREVIMYGDNIPWLLGRTLIPQETLTGEDQQLVDIGAIPLGRYLFSHDNLSRDYIQIGLQNSRWIRRSLLRLSEKPLLLTELFLPESPAYKI